HLLVRSRRSGFRGRLRSRLRRRVPRPGAGVARNRVVEVHRARHADVHMPALDGRRDSRFIGLMVARIDDFDVGQHVTFTKTFTEDDLRRFVEITGDENPLHVDDEFAARTPFGRRVLHGMLTASIFSTMVGMLLPGTGAIYRSQTLTFLLPVHLNE